MQYNSRGAPFFFSNEKKKMRPSCHTEDKVDYIPGVVFVAERKYFKGISEKKKGLKVFHNHPLLIVKTP